MLARVVGLIILLGLGGWVQAGMEWSFLDWAQTNQDKHSVLSPISVTIDGIEFSAQYVELIKDGDRDPSGSDEVLGQLYDQSGNILHGTSDEGIIDESWKLISHNPDYASLLQVGQKLFSVVHFEQPEPSGLYVLELEQSIKGDLSVSSLHYLNASMYNGIWNPCAGSVSPWNTHLGSEEYSPSAWQIESSESFEDFMDKDKFIGRKVVQHMRYFGLYEKWVNIYNIREYFHPYLYGYPFEVTFQPDGTYTLVKHMAMGRTSIELPRVMPDNRTVYITNDGTNKPFLMFKASTPGDLSAGELFVAKFLQLNDVEGGQFEVEWISLGEAKDDDFSLYARDIKFFDMFDFVQPMLSMYPLNNGCPDGYTSINSNIAHECLRVKQGMEIWASRFETERYGAMMGGTTEFSKWEGITHSAYDNRLYTSMSVVKNGMEDFQSKGRTSSSYDKGGYNDVRLEYNRCGCVYYLELNEEYVAVSMNSFICGETYDEFKFSSNADIEIDNECHLDKIASPDNLAAVDGHAGLLIAEDSDGHQNNILWYYDLKTEQLSRILSGPYGSEITGVYFYPNINGFSYIFAQVQHPYGQRDQEKLHEEDSYGRHAVVGYFGPFPAMTMNEETVSKQQEGEELPELGSSLVVDYLDQLTLLNRLYEGAASLIPTAVSTPSPSPIPSSNSAATPTSMSNFKPITSDQVVQALMNEAASGGLLESEERDDTYVDTPPPPAPIEKELGLVDYPSSDDDEQMSEEGYQSMVDLLQSRLQGTGN